MNLFRGNLYENLRMGLDTLWQHKLRSLLTILGVVIGTMTVIVIAAFVSGIDARVSKEIESFGTNSIYIYRFDPGFNFNPTPGRAHAQAAQLRRHAGDRSRMSVS